jgi:hypothetical protein
MIPALVFGLFAAAVAVCLLDLDSFLSPEAAAITLLAASIGAAITTALWPKRAGATGGMIIVCLAYPITWTAYMIGAVAAHGSGGSIGLWVVAYIMYAATSFVFTGWFTIPAGAALGYWLNRRSATTDGKPAASPWVPSQTRGCI